MKYQKIALLFPGQGAQAVGMGRDFYEKYTCAREVFQYGDEILKRSLSKMIFEGPEERLVETGHCQPAIYLTSYAILKAIEHEFPGLRPAVCSGLSLGEYTALTASSKIPFETALALVQFRGEAMQEACHKTQGTMAALFGLSAEEVEKMVQELSLPSDLWVANFNCPGQTVISGTLLGVQRGIEEAKARGAKRAIPLKVHGAFHSGLMALAEKKLEKEMTSLTIQESPIQVVMNVPGDFVKDFEMMRKNLIKQVTSSVRWQQGIQAMAREGVDLFIEIGPGKTLAGMNRQMGMVAPTLTINKREDLELLNELLQ